MATPKQRIIDAFQLRESDGIVPAWDIEFQPVEEFFGKSYILGKDLAALSEGKRERAYYANAELLITIAERFDQSAIAVPPQYWKGSYLWLPTWEDELGSLRALKELVGDSYLIVGNADGTFSIPEGSKMVEFTYRLNDAPDEMKEEAEKSTQKAINRGRMLIDQGVDAILMGADYCFNTGPFLSPTLFAEFITPYLARQVEAFHRAGAFTIKHTDGNILPILDQLLKCRPTAIHSLDPGAGMDIKEVKELTGRQVCLIGNVDCRALQSGTPEDVYKSAVYSLRYGMPGGGFVYSCSNVIMRDVPRENYLAMVRAREEVGLYTSSTRMK